MSTSTGRRICVKVTSRSFEMRVFGKEANELVHAFPLVNLGYSPTVRDAQRGSEAQEERPAHGLTGPTKGRRTARQHSRTGSIRRRAAATCLAAPRAGEHKRAPSAARFRSPPCDQGVRPTASTVAPLFDDAWLRGGQGRTHLDEPGRDDEVEDDADPKDPPTRIIRRRANVPRPTGC